MSDKYVSTVTLEINGKKVADFQSFTEKKIPLRKSVKLMGRTGTAKVTREYGALVDYVMPAGRPQFDFASVENGTLRAVYEDGPAVILTGVSCLEIGEGKASGDNEIVKTIDFMATGRREE
ncbi:MAG: hypothetical protein AB7V08_08550 [Elusimicrobiales bacterium]